MKKLIYFIAFIALVALGCTKTSRMLYSDVNRVLLQDSATINYTFLNKPVTVTKDTVFIRVNTIGTVSNQDREVTITQVLEPDKPNPAVEGVQYVKLNDPELKKHMVIKANAVTGLIPIVLLRDASLKNNTYRLRIMLQANNNFNLGETKSISCAIVFSDRLERFYSWRFDTTVAPAFNTFGKYSTAKHQFMTDVVNTIIDETWYETNRLLGSLTHFNNFFKDKLNAFNIDPVNVANGKAPLKESSEPGSALVTFP